MKVIKNSIPVILFICLLTACKSSTPDKKEAAPAEEKTAGGIIIPDTAKEKPVRGKVVAVGAGKKDEPITVKAGDTVLYGKYGGTEVKVDGKDYVILRADDVLAVLQEEKVAVTA